MKKRAGKSDLIRRISMSDMNSNWTSQSDFLQFQFISTSNTHTHTAKPYLKRKHHNITTSDFLLVTFCSNPSHFPTNYFAKHLEHPQPLTHPATLQVFLPSSLITSFSTSSRWNHLEPNETTLPRRMKVVEHSQSLEIFFSWSQVIVESSKVPLYILRLYKLKKKYPALWIQFQLIIISVYFGIL